jgi:hypothetical protein
MKKYDERSVISSLKRTLSINVKPTSIGYNTLELREEDRPKIGIHTWGKLDYLMHYCNYTLTFIKKVGDQVVRTPYHER